MKSLFPIIFIVLSLGVLFFVGRPMYNDISSLREDISAYDTALTHSTELQKVRDTLIANYKSITPVEKERLIKFLPNTVDNIQLILNLQQIATTHNIGLKNIKFDAPEATSSKTDDKGNTVPNVENDINTSRAYGIFNLEFKTETTYNNFLLFLKDVEQNLRLVDVNAITFDVKEKSYEEGEEIPAEDTYDFSIKTQTYWLKH